MSESKQVAKWRREVSRLEAERAEIIAASTAVKLEENRQASLVAMHNFQEALRAESAIVAAAPMSPEWEALRLRNKEIISLVHGISREAVGNAGSIPQKFIRADARAFFTEEYLSVCSEKAKLQQEIERVTAHPNTTAGPRLTSRLAELEASSADWASIERLCEWGERIFELQEEGRRNSEEMERIQAERREVALTA